MAWASSTSHPQEPLRVLLELAEAHAAARVPGLAVRLVVRLVRLNLEHDSADRAPRQVAYLGARLGHDVGVVVVELGRTAGLADLRDLGVDAERLDRRRLR